MFPGIRGRTLNTALWAIIWKPTTPPLIGSHPEYPNCFFALCGGENGILFSEIAANLIVDLCRGNTPETADLFSPQR